MATEESYGSFFGARFRKLERELAEKVERDARRRAAELAKENDAPAPSKEGQTE